MTNDPTDWHQALAQPEKPCHISYFDLGGFRRAHESWWSVQRPIACEPFFSRACAVLVSAHDGGVDHHVLVVVIAGQQLENTVENPALRPSAETLMDRFPMAETLR